MKKSPVLISALCSISLLCCCSGSSNLRPIDELRTQSDQKNYVVKANDVLMVKVWGEAKLSGEVTVRNDGKFSMPLINDVPAEGRELTDIAEAVKIRLKDYVPAASVSVSLIQAAPTRYYLSGSFTKPGEYRSDGRITLLQAIATGNGFAPFANESDLSLIRQTAEGEVRYEIDYNRVIDGSQPNPELRTGDVIAVH